MLSTLPMHRSTFQYDVAVIGAGPAGLSAACALAAKGIRTAVLAAPHRPAGNKVDTRTAALFNASIRFLDRVGAWEGCRRDSEPMAGIRLIDDTGGLLKAPELLFRSEEIGEAQFGYNIPQVPLTAALRKAGEAFGDLLTLIETEGVEDVVVHQDHAELGLRDGSQVTCDLVAAADGRGSIGRTAAGIETDTTYYDQSAVTCVFRHARPHGNISTEFHRKAGPCTVVPMPGNASSLVWVERPAVAERLYAMSDVEFLRTLTTQLKGLLGPLSDLGPRALFPLAHMSAKRVGANRTALIGEAAHVMPPIGAQGLNLSLRDAAALADIAADAKAAGQPLGSDSVLQAYERERRLDIRSRGMMVDILNRALTSDLLPVQLGRGFGLHMINALPPVKKALMREGMQPSGALPSLMQG